jgi:hypothetical protein
MAQTGAERVAAHRERGEQEIRAEFGYAPSESRTQAERAATAKRIVAKCHDEIAVAEAIWASQGARAPVPRRLAVPK